MKNHLQRTALFLALCLLLLVAAPAMASTQEASSLQAEIDAYVKAHEATTAALSVAVFEGDNILYMGRYGDADKENGIKNTEDTVFEWGSCTKLLVWSSVMQLYEQGKLDLHADVRSYLPEGFLKKLKYDAPITMLHLMNHNAGWQDAVVELFVPEGRKLRSLEAQLLSSQPAQIHVPGTTVAYSNWGVGLAGYIVERISGMPFYEYVQKNIFAPLDITHTALNADLSDNAWVAAQRKNLACYSRDAVRLGYPHFYVPLYPAGMATGTIENFCRFAQALTAAPGSPYALFEKEETRSLFYSPSCYYPNGTSAENCHGMWVSRFGGREMLGHGGNTAGCSAQLCFDPASGEGMVVMTNQSGELTYCTGLYKLLYGEIAAPYAPALEQTPDMQGFYMCERTVKKGMLKLYTLSGLIPVMQEDGGEPYVPGGVYSMTRVAHDTYLVEGGSTEMLFYIDAPNGRAERLSMMTQDYSRVDEAELFVMALMLCLFILSFLYALCMLVAALVRCLRKKPQPLGALRALTNGAVVFVSLSFLLLALMLLSYVATKQQVILQGILFLLLALVPLAFTAQLLRKGKELSKREKAALWCNAFMGLAMTANVIYWQMYMFWV